MASLEVFSVVSNHWLQVKFSGLKSGDHWLDFGWQSLGKAQRALLPIAQGASYTVPSLSCLNLIFSQEPNFLGTTLDILSTHCCQKYLFLFISITI